MLNIGLICELKIIDMEPFILYLINGGEYRINVYDVLI